MDKPTLDEIDDMKLINFGKSGHTDIENVLDFLYKKDRTVLASHVVNLIRAHQYEKAKNDVLDGLTSYSKDS